MTGSETKSSLAQSAWPLALSLCLPLLLLTYLGQDSNWDLLNYHLYNPHAWLRGRLGTDIAPAQLQSWHNPLLDVPLYLMVRAGASGAVIGVWLTLPFVFALYWLLRLYLRLAGENASRMGLLAVSVLTCTGAAAVSELGTSFNDGFVAAGILGALWLLLRSESSRLRDWTLAGLLAGATVGLKLTAGIYCLGLAAAAIAWLPLRTAPARLGCLLVGGLIGFLLAYGDWGWTLYRLHGNPFFPYFNQIFRSSDALPQAYADVRFRPSGAIDALTAPLQLLRNTQHYSELTLRDPRLLLGLLSGLFLLRQRGVDPIARAPWRALAAFFLVAFFAWDIQFGIYRYALPLEMLACMGCVLALQRLPARSSVAVLPLAAIAVIAATHVPNWGRQAFRQPMVRTILPVLPPKSLLIVSTQEPVGYAALAVPDDVRIVAIYNSLMRPEACTTLQIRAERIVSGHEGPLWLLRGPSVVDDDGERIAHREFGLSVAGPCLPMPSTLGDLKLCPLRWDTRPPLCLSGATNSAR